MYTCKSKTRRHHPQLTSDTCIHVSQRQEDTPNMANNMSQFWNTPQCCFFASDGMHFQFWDYFRLVTWYIAYVCAWCSDTYSYSSSCKEPWHNIIWSKWQWWVVDHWSCCQHGIHLITLSICDCYNEWTHFTIPWFTILAAFFRNSVFVSL